MYLQGVYEGSHAAVLAATKPPGGPGMDPEGVAKLEVWCTQFGDPGPDYTEFKAFDMADRPLWTRRVNGY